MDILVFNCGSSSLKYRLIRMPDEIELAGGEAQRIGPPTAEPSRIVYRNGGTRDVRFVPMKNHAEAFKEVMNLLKTDSNLTPDVFGHRVVHGGDFYSGAVLIDSSVLHNLHTIKSLAPIHNPPALRLIEACKKLRPDLPQVAVFDTAFHVTMPDVAKTYALPRKVRETLKIRKYGFHGTSHKFVAQEAAKFLGKPFGEFNAVSAHLGSGGASLCAIVNGRSVDNTLGFSPLQGLMMSTRSGDIDPAVVLKLIANAGGRGKAVEELLNKRSGVMGMSGSSADIRDVLKGASEAGTQAERFDLTAKLYLWRIRKYLGAYLAAVGDTDAVIFTDTIGETVPEVRWAVCSGMEAFGLMIDPRENAEVKTYPADVATDESPVRVLVILTNEELAIARDTFVMMTTA